MYKPNENRYEKMISPLCHTPPMGWNSWNTFSWNINAELIMSSADKMVDTGLAEALGVQERQLKS